MASTGAAYSTVSPPVAQEQMQAAGTDLKIASTGAVPPAISPPVAAKPQPMQAAGADYKMASADATHQAISPPVATNPQPMQAADATPIMHAPAPVREPPTVTKRHSLDMIRHPNAAGALLQGNVV